MNKRNRNKVSLIYHRFLHQFHNWQSQKQVNMIDFKLITQVASQGNIERNNLLSLSTSFQLHAITNNKSNNNSQSNSSKWNNKPLRPTNEKKLPLPQLLKNTEVSLNIISSWMTFSLEISKIGFIPKYSLGKSCLPFGTDLPIYFRR